MLEQINEQQEAKELEEDQSTADHAAQITGPPLPSSLKMENTEDILYAVATGEHNTPKYLIMDGDIEVLAFQNSFTTGTGGFNTNRIRDLLN